MVDRSVSLVQYTRPQAPQPQLLLIPQGESDVRFNPPDTLTDKETAKDNRRFAPTDDHDRSYA